MPTEYSISSVVYETSDTQGIMRLIPFIISAVCLLVSCGTAPVRHFDAPVEYFSEGFIDSDNFQVLAKGSPRKNTRTLVDRRESSLEDARLKIPERQIEVLTALAESQSPVPEPCRAQKTEIIRRTIQQAINGHLAGGREITSFYNVDGGATIVFRVSRAGIKQVFQGLSYECPVSQTAVTDAHNKNN